MTPPLVTRILPEYCLVLIELFHPLIHGMDEQSDPSIVSHFLVHSCYHAGYLCEDQSIVFPFIPLKEMIPCYKKTIQRHQQQIQLNSIHSQHPIIRNYINMIQLNQWNGPHIAKCIVLQGGEKVAILKTYWIRLIQRTWKRIYHNSLTTTSSSSSSSSCSLSQNKNKKKNNILPQKRLQGMLSPLKNQH